ncbi:MAG: hypothetical protein WD512_11920 [Candidatus Paceibacterota bacterium]
MDYYESTYTCDKCKKQVECINYPNQFGINYGPFYDKSDNTLCRQCFVYAPKPRQCDTCKRSFISNGSFKKHLPCNDIESIVIT